MNQNNYDPNTDTSRTKENVPPFNGQYYTPPNSEPDLPQYDSQYYGPQSYDPQSYYQSSQDLSTENNSLGILCLVLSIVGFLSGAFVIGLLLDLLAIVLGVMSLAKGSGKKSFSIVGIIISILSILLTVAFYIAIAWVDSSSTPPVTGATSYQAPAIVDEAVLLENVAYQDYETDFGIVVLFDNANSQDVSIEAKIVYYDENGKLLDTGETYLPSCAANGTGSVVIPLPTTKNSFEPIPYQSYDIVCTVTAVPKYTSPNLGDQIDIQTNILEDGSVEATFRNNSGVSFDNVEIMCIYWKDGRIVGYSSQYLWDFKKNRKATETFNPPYDSEYRTLSYDNFEMYINSTSSYD